jgi:ribosomal subunit interface protein
MKMTIHAHHLAVPDDLPAYLEKHVTRPLAHVFDDSAAELAVHLGDARPRRGGVDQECKLTFRIPGLKMVHAESVAEDIHAALLQAGDRLKRAVKKELQKRRSPPRKTARRRTTPARGSSAT